MMKRISFVITALIAMLMNVSAMDNNDFLKASGKVLKKNSGTGDVVYLRGTNAGNLGIQEPWMCTTQGTDNVKCERDIYALLTRRFGADGAQMLLNTYRDNYFTVADFDHIASMGLNCIRLPLWYRDFENADGTMRSDAFTWLDWFVEEAGKRGIYVIIDMHGAHGSQNGRDHSGACASQDNSWDEIWASEFFFGDNASANQEKYYTLWEKIADHYKGNPAVAGYDILNEPFCTYRYSNYEVYGTTWNESNLHNLLWGIYNTAYSRIRAKDPDHLIIMEATWDPWDLPNPSNYGWTNVMYEYHQYEYSDYDNNEGKQIQGINNKVNNIKNQNHDVPSFIGEVCFFNQQSTWSQGLQIMNRNNLHWTTWSYKCISDYGNWGLMNENSGKINLETASYDEILAKWKGLHSASWVNSALSKTVSENITTIPITPALPAGEYYITAFENKIVNTNGTNPMIANGSSYTGATSQIFIVEDNGDGTVAIKAKVNNKYVCAVKDENGQLTPRSGSIGDWEKFEMIPTANANEYGILALANNKYVKADYNDTSNNGQLKAASESVSGWEAFKFTLVPSGPVQINVNIADYTEKSSKITINSNGYAGDTGDGLYLSYSVNFPQIGNYTLTMPLAAGDAQWNAKSLNVKLDNNIVATMNVTGSSGWENFINHTCQFSVSAAGTHTLTLVVNGGACNISSFTLSKQ